MRIGIVSGYFNPVHYGHIEYINAAKQNCDKLIAVINSDYQRELKGSKEFMDELYNFSKIHQYDDRHTYKEEWDKWINKDSPTSLSDCLVECNVFTNVTLLRRPRFI